MPRVARAARRAASPATIEVVFARWDEVVGGDLGEHVRPLRVDGATLVVAVDHPAWATRARMRVRHGSWPRVRALGEARSSAWRSWSSGATVRTGPRRGPSGDRS